MAADSTIAKNIAQKYAGADRKEVVGLLKHAAAAGRADEQKRLAGLLSDYREVLVFARSVPGQSRVERLKNTWAIKTFDAMIDVLFSTLDKEG